MLAVSIDGIAKHWILSSHSEMKDMGGCIVEEKSQNLDLPSPPLSLSSYCYQGTHCTVLVVCKEIWQVNTCMHTYIHTYIHTHTYIPTVPVKSFRSLVISNKSQQ